MSIIIPFYNVEQYIAECLASVFQQDIPEEEYEVVCVNDGSTDRSRDIVREYQARHKNLVMVEHEVNRKLGAARNTGRAAAKGNYIWNVDSDDKIVPNCLGKLIETCEKYDLDVLEFSTTQFHEEGEGEIGHVRLTEGVMSGLVYLNQLESRELSRLCVVWRRVIRHSFLDENHIFSPEINMGEDVPYSFRVLMLARRMMVIPDRCYRYRANPNSLTGKQWKPKPDTLYEKCFLDSRLIYEVAIEVPEKYVNVRNSYTDAARYTLCRYSGYVSQLSAKDRKAFRRLCRKAFWKNDFVKALLPIKRYISYLLWLSGLKALPE